MKNNLLQHNPSKKVAYEYLIVKAPDPLLPQRKA